MTRASGVGFVIALVIVATACTRATPIPAGATVVRIAVSGSEVRLDRPTVPAGDVYLVLEVPPDGSISFVERQDAADAAPGPLSDEDLARLARGDTEGTSVSGMSAGGCAADQDRADRGMVGPCGNVMKVSVVAGRYAIVGGATERDPATGRVAPMAVLEVR